MLLRLMLLRLMLLRLLNSLFFLFHLGSPLWLPFLIFLL